MFCLCCTIVARKSPKTVINHKIGISVCSDVGRVEYNNGELGVKPQKNIQLNGMCKVLCFAPFLYIYFIAVGCDSMVSLVLYVSSNDALTNSKKKTTQL